MARAVIVGAGVVGAALAHRLGRDGWDVVLVEPHEPGHARAASGGESRLLRCAHGDDAWYARSARRARTLWRELEAETGAALLVECGVAWLARRADGFEADSERVLRAEGIPAARARAEDLFPSVAADDLAFVLWEPEAGVLRAAEATRALVRAAIAHGARVMVASARPEGAGVRAGGERLAGDAVVWACGAWLPALFPDLLGGVRVTRQVVTFFGAADPRWRAPAAPGWVDYDGAFYGTGDVDGWGVKVAPDVEGEAFDPERGSRLPDPGAERAARAYLRHRFPALAGAPLVGARVCQYAITADSHFIAAPHPEHPAVWLVGGDSGHGFKHGPALAERLAAWIGGREAPDPRLALGPRAAGRSLRTAGR
jgi:sarcosine oxidase